MKKYKLIVFDWDGTLVDSIPRVISCMKHAAETLGLSIPLSTDIKNTIGLSMDEAVRLLYPGIYTRQLAQFKQEFKQQFVYDSKVESRLFTGVKKMLANLQEEGIELAIATGKIRPGLIRSLYQFSLMNTFSALQCADEKISKPDPQMLINISSHLAIETELILMVGDSIYDLQMANSAKIDVVAVANGAHSERQLAQYNPLHVLPNISHLKGWLDRDHN